MRLKMSLLFGLIVITLFLPASVARAAATNAAAQAAVTRAYLQQTRIPRKLLILEKSIVVYPYAIQPWGTQHMGGEALLHYESPKGWKLLSGGGGAWEVSSLVQQRVPRSIAERLIVGVRLGLRSVTAAQGSALTAALATYDATRQRGFAATTQGDFQNALSYFNRAAAINPDTRPTARAYDRCSVQAVNETLAALQAGRITSAEAPTWFANRQGFLMTHLSIENDGRK